MAPYNPESSTEDLHSEASTPGSPPDTPETESPSKPPSLRQPSDTATPPNMSVSSGPLGPTQAGRRPGPPGSRPSDLPQNLQERMKAMMLSRQNPRPSFGPGQPNSTGNMQAGTTGAPPAGPPKSPAGAMSGGMANMRLPPNMQRPQGQHFSSAPSIPAASPRANPKAPMGGLSAKRGLKPGGMKLSDAMKPATEDSTAETEKQDTGSQFSKFANIVDTQKGTLTFKNKAVVHGTGIDFSSGSTFSISLDEVDTIDELGKGNYGTVFKVRHARPKMRRQGQGLRGNMSKSALDSDTNTSSNGGSTTGLVMAMKEIRLELDDAKFAQIIMELDILHRCVSPFIIDFYGAFFQEGSVYICIEYMDGGSIDKIYGDGVPEGPLKKITLSTVMGLKYLKDEHNIIHRDVKPTNILVNTRGQVKICDFGVSGNLVASIARTNIGCQSYMAPERISGGGMSQAGANPGGGTYSVQSDIWSLGLSIIECALGRYPYPPETYDNIFSQLSAIVDGEPPGLPTDKYSPLACEFVQGCLNKVPKMRPTYAALIRHAWLAPLMLPPTISEDEEAEAAAEAGGDASAASGEAAPDTADKEVAAWVKSAIERKRSGKMAESAKPALHAAPLDTVPGSPLEHQAVEVAEAMHTAKPLVTPNPGIRVDSPELVHAKVHSLDFASGVGQAES